MSVDDDEDDRTIVSRAKIEGSKTQQRPAALELIAGAGAPKKYVLALPAYVIGRDPGSDIHIPSPEMSRRHLRVMRVGEEIMAVDQESANGTFLNGVKIHSSVLREGDQIQLGDVVLVFRERA